MPHPEWRIAADLTVEDRANDARGSVSGFYELNRVYAESIIANIAAGQQPKDQPPGKITTHLVARQTRHVFQTVTKVVGKAGK